jgi:hypothetical protein
MVINGDKSKFAQWSANGALATAGWVLVLIVYCAFRAFGIEDPIIGQAFLLLTGLWVGNLTIAQGKKQARVEQTAVEAKEKVEALETRADESDLRQDASFERETGWSQHKDHGSED